MSETADERKRVKGSWICEDRVLTVERPESLPGEINLIIYSESRGGNTGIRVSKKKLLKAIKELWD